MEFIFLSNNFYLKVFKLFQANFLEGNLLGFFLNFRPEGSYGMILSVCPSVTFFICKYLKRIFYSEFFKGKSLKNLLTLNANIMQCQKNFIRYMFQPRIFLNEDCLIISKGIHLIF